MLGYSISSIKENAPWAWTLKLLNSYNNNYFENNGNIVTKQD